MGVPLLMVKGAITAREIEEKAGWRNPAVVESRHAPHTLRNSTIHFAGGYYLISNIPFCRHLLLVSWNHEVSNKATVE